MPTYDFRCKKCSYKFFRRVNYNAKDDVKCPECNEKAEQIFTGFLYKKPGGSDDSGSSAGGCSGSCSGCSGC